MTEEEFNNEIRCLVDMMHDSNITQSEINTKRKALVSRCYDIVECENKFDMKLPWMSEFHYTVGDKYMFIDLHIGLCIGNELCRIRKL